MINNTKKQEIVERRARGESLNQIATALLVSKTTVISCVKESAHLIRNAANIEKDAFLSRLQMTSAKRLEHKIELMKKISEELLGRDFSKVPAEKLLDMLFDLEEKTTGALKVQSGELKKFDPMAELLASTEPQMELLVSDLGL